MNSYELSRNWFDFCFENPEKIKPIHTAIYFFAIEHNNRLGWKEKFGFPSQMVMETLGIKNWRTYSKALMEIVDFGFIEMIEKSKNQYSSNIITLQSATVKNTKALDKALSKHSQKHTTKQGQSTVSINKQTNKEQRTKNSSKPPSFNFRKKLIDLGFKENLVVDWLEVRKKKKATNSETALNGFLNEVEKTEMDLNTVLEHCVVQSWAGFKASWLEKEKNFAQKKEKVNAGVLLQRKYGLTQ